MNKPPKLRLECGTAAVSPLRSSPAAVLDNHLVSLPTRARKRFTPLPREDQAQRRLCTPRYVELTREWIETCNKLHGSTCVPNPISQRPLEDVPLWLIDTHKQCIVPGISAHRYLALSYVWPESRSSKDTSTPPPRTLLLDSANLKDLQRPGSLSSPSAEACIPSVIQHAIAFTRVLGETFLWVDRLCIVQDDVEVDGTLSQVGKMDKIYNGACLSIIAAASDDIYEEALGCEWPVFESAVAKRWWEQCDTPRDDSTRLDRDRVVEIMCSRYNTLSRSRWATRGWTYQEQILCKRAIVFVDDGFFWDCHCSMWDAIELFPGQNFEDSSLRADMGQRLHTRWWPDFSLYLDLICPYNGREFSYSQDAMLGIAGVLNVLGKSFPGGFVHGLPRMFLDHALLWQPFGAAERRVDQGGDGDGRSSLPSWSWVGWQCYIDPGSMRSGMSYIEDESCRQRSGTWRTRNLVTWHYSEDQSPGIPILEPVVFDQLVDTASFDCDGLMHGWRRCREVEYDDQKNIVRTHHVFEHDNEQHRSFRHPIPLNNRGPQQNLMSTSAHLSCVTNTVTFTPATMLIGMNGSSYTAHAPPKISVFEETMFKDGPSNGACPVLVLQQPNGAFAGLLRLTTKETLDQTTPLELVAISTGSATARDVQSSLEWRIFETLCDEYHNENHGQTTQYGPAWISQKGKVALLFNVHEAFHQDAAGTLLSSRILATYAETQQRARVISENITLQFRLCESNDIRPWLQARSQVLDFEIGTENGTRQPDVRRKSNSARTLWDTVRRATRNGFLVERMKERGSSSLCSDDALCHLYNVLWIERKDEVAYRRACGWVPKAIWEAYTSGPVEVKLG